LGVRFQFLPIRTSCASTQPPAHPTNATRVVAHSALACVPALYGAFDVLGEKFGHLGHPLEEIGIRLQISTGIPYNRRMRTVIETPTFQKQAAKLWTEGERLEFIDWIAENPLAGDVIPGAEGARKVRWSRRGSGRSGGARVIYFNLTEQEVVLLVAAYAKADRANMLAAEIKKGV